MIKPEEVDVRTVGWNTDCEERREIDDSYQDDDGDWHSVPDWEYYLKCEIKTIDAKHDKCLTCGKILRYP
jgi:hypothetical protein